MEMRTEQEKTELKRALFIEGSFSLSEDSLTGEILNPEFEAIESDLFQEVIKGVAEERRKETALINELLNGKTINLNEKGF